MFGNINNNLNRGRRAGRKDGRGRRRSLGFTMAELLVVVAIIGILAGVSFVAVQQHQKSMTQLQYDAIAKEIFVAAQNHLTLAKSENYKDIIPTEAGESNGNSGNVTADPRGYKDSSSKDVWYLTNENYTSTGSSILDQMLPFGAVELVTGGNFIIRYQPNAARVLDVFYWTNDSRYGISSGVDYQTAVEGYRENSNKAKRAAYQGGKGILGWFGGEVRVDSGEYLEAPTIEVINEEMLLVKVTDPNTSDHKIKLIIEGTAKNAKGETAKIAIPLDGIESNGLNGFASGERVVPGTSVNTYFVVLDDITSEGLHFADLAEKGGSKTPKNTMYTEKQYILPGENITLKAVAYSDEKLTSVAYSGEWTTNSLFAEVKVDDSADTNVLWNNNEDENVYISNIRHLENMGTNISDFMKDTENVYAKRYFGDYIRAVQTSDLSWNDFITAIRDRKGNSADVCIFVRGAVSSNDNRNKCGKGNCYLPINTTYALTYNGRPKITTVNEAQNGSNQKTTTLENHSISNVVTNNAGDAGLFGKPDKAITVKNLALIDFSVTGTGNVGALVGTLPSESTVQNIVAYNTTGDAGKTTQTETGETDSNADGATEPRKIITTNTGNAGGLIGQIGNQTKSNATNATATSVEKCAAALIVKCVDESAGGLIGIADDNTTVTACYAGGHTVDNAATGAVYYDSADCNVTAAAGAAGGLIGSAGKATVNYSYSTCSVKGTTAGGFVGKGSGDYTSCYATGLVVGATEQATKGAFAGNYSGKASGCLYFEIVNEIEDTTNGGYSYLSAVPPVTETNPTGSYEGITALDADAATYDTFSGGNWKSAVPYDEKLPDYYGKTENGKRIALYNLETVAQLSKGQYPVAEAETKDSTGNVTALADYVATHYGDWPSPEIFVINTK